MTLNDAALVIAGNAVDSAITHMQLHSGAPGAAGTSNTTSAGRVAVNGTVDSDGDITWTDINFTGGAPGGGATHVSYWTASSGGTYLGSAALTGDTTFNSAGEYTITSLTESNVSA